MTTPDIVEIPCSHQVCPTQSAAMNIHQERADHGTRERCAGCSSERRAAAKIFASIELSKDTWVVGLHLPTQNKISVFSVNSGAVDALLRLFDWARHTVVRAGIENVEIHSCDEASDDGFWLHRALIAQGVHNLVLDAASIQVNRRARRVRTDRTDAARPLSGS